MGMRYEDFWYNYDLSELGNAISGYYNREERHNREQWEQIRLLYTAMINKPVYGYKIKPQKPNKLLPLPWDSEGYEPPSNDVINELRKEIWGQQQ